MARSENPIIPLERVQNHILLIRGQKVIVDSELAELYGVTTSRLKRTGKAQPRQVSRQFRVSARQRGVRELEIAFCDIKFNLGWASKTALCLHGTWGVDDKDDLNRRLSNREQQNVEGQ